MCFFLIVIVSKDISTESVSSASLRSFGPHNNESQDEAIFCCCCLFHIIIKESLQSFGPQAPSSTSHRIGLSRSFRFTDRVLNEYSISTCVCESCDMCLVVYFSSSHISGGEDLSLQMKKMRQNSKSNDWDIFA